MIRVLQYFSAMGRNRKIALQVVVDAIIIVLCFLAAMSIRLESFVFLENQRIWIPLAISTTFAIITFWHFGLYRTLVRFVTGKILTSISHGIAAFAIFLFALNAILSAGIPRSVPLISSLLLFVTISGLRFLMRNAFRAPMHVSKKPVVIYGAGSAGLALLHSLYHGRDYIPLAFVDDDRNLQGLTVGGIPVLPPEDIPKLAEDSGVEVVLLAMPNLSRARRREIFAALESTKIEVKTIPGLTDIISGKAKISELRNVTPEDLLGRDAVAPNQTLLERKLSGRVVMVTGAGGSIGSELCRQIILQQPSSLILFEISEFALYSIEAELSETIKQLGLSTKIVPVLGSVQNAKRLEAAIRAFSVETIYHAAAYKHVPLVEENVVEGIRNNVFGTLTIAKLALENGVRDFILISTDKAVRPTNVMGATKRVAELICQAFAREQSKTTFSMVRFGNVLGSSGSVIPRFRAQIEAGGPVTVTHRDITRYFMTIPEASQLVIQAGAMAKGGEVFVLDMGEPVKIADLAVTMVKLHGLTPYFADQAADDAFALGDIEIRFTGLRKGEKLFEELLIEANAEPTEHPRIMFAKEVSMSGEELLPILDRLLAASKSYDLAEIYEIFCALPLEYNPAENELYDLVWAAARTRKRGEVGSSIKAAAAGR